MKTAIIRYLCYLSVLAVLIAISSGSFDAQIRSDFDREMNLPVEPFRIIGNIYYVGASDVTSFLITTEEGHILIDAGFRETVPLIKSNIASLGFKIEDVRILLINHAHYDHAGGLADIKEATGARLLASKEEVPDLEKGGQVEEFSYDPVEVDEILDDGDVVKLGGVRLKANLTPGHTKGCTTFTGSFADKGRDLDVVFLCSLSALNYALIDNEDYPGIAEDFEATFERLLDLKVDVFLSSHGSFFGLKRKTEGLASRSGDDANPFIDRDGYRSFVIRMRAAFKEKLEEQRGTRCDR